MYWYFNKSDSINQNSDFFFLSFLTICHFSPYSLPPSSLSLPPSPYLPPHSPYLHPHSPSLLLLTSLSSSSSLLSLPPSSPSLPPSPNLPPPHLPSCSHLSLLMSIFLSQSVNISRFQLLSISSHLYVVYVQFSF